MKTQTFEDWLDDYRTAFYERTKNIADADVGKQISISAHEAAKQFGFSIIKASPYVNTEKINLNLLKK
jgi:hypothetical protein